MIQLPTLYKSTKTGATQVCKISHENDKFTVEFGQLDGKMQTKATTCFYTNEGRANERDPYAQAAFEATAKWKKKCDTGYRIEQPNDVSADADVVLLPQKVKVYQDQLHNVNDYVYESDKLDGVNGIYRLNDDELLLYSRGGLLYPAIPHVEADIIRLMRDNKFTAINVEVYIPDTHLQLIQSAVKKPKELSKSLQIRIFELPDDTDTYIARLAKMMAIDEDYITPHIQVIPANLIHKSRINRCYDDAVSRGCEGLIIRNATGLYKYNERSSDVFKYKKTQSAEYQILNFDIDKNDEIESFRCKPKGTREVRQQMAINGHDYVGKWFTIEYETLSMSNVPLKPVGISLREMSPKGEPLE